MVQGFLSFSIRESDRCLETLLLPPTTRRRQGPFSIRESDRCLETSASPAWSPPPARLSVSASRIVASKPEPTPQRNQLGGIFQYPRVGSLPRNFDPRLQPIDVLELSVSASRIVASKHQPTAQVNSAVQTFSIRESDRCLETSPKFAVAGVIDSFSIRESDRCLETGIFTNAKA